MRSSSQERLNWLNGRLPEKTDSMILKNKNGQPAKISSKGFFIKLVFIKYCFLLLLTALLAIGIYIGSKNIQTKGYSGLFDFITTVSSNYLNGNSANPEN